MKQSAETLRILVPLDGSPLAEAILPALMPLASTRRVEVTLLRVINRVDELEKERGYLFQTERDLQKDGIRAVSRLEFGRPAEEILHLAKPGAFDLLAMSTHGHTALLRIIMGSVAARVLRRVRIPILLHTPRAKITDWKRIVVSLDGTVGAEAILEDVGKLAGVLGSTVHLVRVTLPLLPTADPYFDPVPIDCEGPKKYVDQVRDRLLQKGILAIPEVREGFAAKEIVRVATQLGAGLIAMSTEGRGGRARPMERSIAAEVLPSTPCSMLLRRSPLPPADQDVSEAKPVHASSESP